VIMMQNLNSPGTPRKGTGFSDIARAVGHRSGETTRPDSAEPHMAAKLSRIILLSHSLKNLDIVETLPAHMALVRHLQFSPNGKWMATCSWDRTCALYKVGNNGVRCHDVYPCRCSERSFYSSRNLSRFIVLWSILKDLSIKLPGLREATICSPSYITV
jgi:WD40 repeat protein